MQNCARGAKTAQKTLMTESNRIEFKRELTRELDIEKEVVAFLNYVN